MYRTRYFKDSGIIGSKEFVSINYQRFKHLFSKASSGESGLEKILGWVEIRM